MIIAKVRVQKSPDREILLLTVPTNSGLKKGDYVMLTKVQE